MPVVDVRYEEDYAVLIIETKTGKRFETKIDVDNVERFRPFNWFQNSYGYIVARDPADPRPGPNLHMQREVMHAVKGEVIDHEFGDVLDNRRAKLRRADRRKNGYHRVRLSKVNTSGRTGVQRSPNGKRWTANIKVNYKYISLGTYDTFEEAVAARVAGEALYCEGFAPKA